MRIIPAIDLIGGKCVRLSQGDYSRKTEYKEDPLDMALRMQDQGVSYLHVVDLDGARAGRIVNWRVLEKICRNTTLKVDAGGGVKTEEDLRILFDVGAVQVNVGSAAIREKELFFDWVREYGPGRIILSADARAGFIAIQGWQEATPLLLEDVLQEYHAAGVMYAVCTDIGQDGLLQGPSIEMYQSIRRKVPGLQVVASGGVSGMADVERLEKLHLSGVIIGKALYEGHITLSELRDFIGGKRSDG
ncbi:MAG: 1-(5-phosphoribosyl)-5-[(5-phosphoribosylamino)methylideneamino]imidazole-4-carboxamide isomerase [Bacteroidetes bacterium]|nr:MAG: 1-(5-phosphoribosyl)-5-[(5-phosphoribosylamino)methylideneamino]imidazole-4-carboxamide isomerase [Bacteroidota bacterium]